MLTQKQEVDNKSKKQESQENNIQLIVPRSNTTKPFDPAEKTLDLVPSLVKLYIIIERIVDLMFRDAFKIWKSDNNVAINFLVLNAIITMSLFAFWCFGFYVIYLYDTDVVLSTFEKIAFWVLGLGIVEMFGVINEIIVSIYKIESC